MFSIEAIMSTDLITLPPAATLAEAIKQDEGRFGRDGGITRKYNQFRCAFHAAKAKQLADAATSYAAAKGRRFWLAFSRSFHLACCRFCPSCLAPLRASIGSARLRLPRAWQCLSRSSACSWPRSVLPSVSTRASSAPCRPSC